MIFRMLAFNTVTELCSVALVIDQKIYYSSMLTSNLHAENILFMIHKLLTDTGIELKSLDCIVFDQGPGSFMGIRLGLSIAQGFALALNLPAVAVSSLAVLAQGAWRKFFSTQVISSIDARMHELYWACYTRQTDTVNQNYWNCIHELCLVNASIAQKIINTLKGKWILVGTGWNINKQLLSYFNAKTATETVILKKIMFPEAQDMLSLGCFAYKKNMLLAPNQISPIYLRTNITKNVILPINGTSKNNQ